jgi:hypothetical protein
VLLIEIDIPGEASLKAKTQAVRVEPVAGLPRFDVGMTLLEMDEKERVRLKTFIMKTVERGTSISKL